MGVFDIKGPNGKQYRIEGKTAEGAFAALQKHLGIQSSAVSGPDGVQGFAKDPLTEALSDGVRARDNGDNATGGLAIPSPPDSQARVVNPSGVMLGGDGDVSPNIAQTAPKPPPPPKAPMMPDGAPTVSRDTPPRPKPPALADDPRPVRSNHQPNMIEDRQWQVREAMRNAPADPLSEAVTPTVGGMASSPRPMPRPAQAGDVPAMPADPVMPGQTQAPVAAPAAPLDPLAGVSGQANEITQLENLDPKAKLAEITARKAEITAQMDATNDPNEYAKLDAEYRALGMDAMAPQSFVQNPGEQAGIVADRKAEAAAPAYSMEQFGKDVAMVPRAIGSALPAMNSGFWQIARGVDRLVGAEKLAAFDEKMAEASNQTAENWKGPADSYWAKQVQGAAQSLGLMLPGFLTSILTGGAATPVVAAMYLTPGAMTQGGQSVGAALDQNIGPGKALFYGALDSAAEVLFEKIPLGHLIKDIGMGAGFGQILKHQLMSEVPTEVATTIFQNFNAYAVLNPEKPFMDFIKEQPQAIADTVAQTALVIFGTSILGKAAAKMVGKGKGGEVNPNLPISGDNLPTPSAEPKQPTDPLAEAISPVQPKPPAPDAAPIAPKADAPAPKPEAEAPKADAPAPDGDFQIMDEEDVVDGKRVSTGRKVRVNMETGDSEVVDEGNSDAVKGEGISGEGPVGVKPQVERDAEVVFPPPPPAAPAKADVPQVEVTPGPAPEIGKPQIDVSVDDEGRAPPLRKFLTHDETLAIQTDPKAFQYKSGGDTEGVTDALKGVEKFDPDRAGKVMLYERKDGTTVVADGHQRTGLARRMAQGGQADVGGTAATVYREADGWTQTEVMVRAALVNIGSGTGTATDAAKILRNTTRTIKDLGLPPEISIVRVADGLRRLSDDAFGQVTNGVASERDGDAVGRNVPDKALHADILGLLTREKPENSAQAAMMARDAASNATTQTQTDMFGTIEVAKSLYKQRAQVLDGATKALETQVKAFGNLIDNADMISGAGNTLDDKANAAVVDDATKIRQYLTSQANMKGPISDALTQAAQAVADGQPATRAAKIFVDAVRKILDGSGPRREDAPGGGTPDEGVTQDKPAAVTPDDPKTDLFGALILTKPVEKPAAPVDDLLSALTPSPGNKTKAQLKADADAAEAKVKAAQSKKGTTVPQADAGLMFETQADVEKPITAVAKPGDALYTKMQNILAPFIAGKNNKQLANAEDLTDTIGGRNLIADLAASPDIESRKKIADKWVVKRGRSGGAEHLVVLDKDGIPLSITRGSPSAVNAQLAVHRMAQAGLVGYATHNHPKSSGLSSSDYLMMFDGFGPIVAVGHNGDRHEAAVGPMMAGIDARFDTPAATNLEPAITLMHGEIQKILQAQVSALPYAEQPALIAEFGRTTWGIVSLALDRMGIITYTGDAEAILAQAGGTLDDYTDSAFSISRDRLRGAGLPVTEIGNRIRDSKTGSIGTVAIGQGTTGQPQGNASGSDGQGGLPQGGKPVKADDFTAAVDNGLDSLFGAKPVAVPAMAAKPSKADAAANLKNLFKEDPTDFLSPLEKTKAKARARPVQRDMFDLMDSAQPGERQVDLEDYIDDLKARDRNLFGMREDVLSQDTYAQAVPLFRAFLAGQDPNTQPIADTVMSVLTSLKNDYDMTRPQIERMMPYLRLYLEDVQAGNLINPKDDENVSGTDSTVEPDSGDANTGDGLGKADVPAGQRGSGPSAGKSGGKADGKSGASDAGSGLPGGDAASVGAKSDQGVRGSDGTDGQPAADRDDSGSGPDSQPRLFPDNGSTKDTRKGAIDGPGSLNDRAAVQAKADRATKSAGVLWANDANIRASLPLLQDVQQDDVLKVETRFAKPDGHGMLLTNGTGSGKTYSAGGVIKRFVMAGKGNILVMAPSDGIGQHWLDALRDLGVDASLLANTKDAGKGVVITTYANAGMNNALANREWDLVVSDEAHKLSSAKDGGPTTALQTMRAITNRPADLGAKYHMMHAEELAQIEGIKRGDERKARYDRYVEARKAGIAKMATLPRGKALFLSATPFAYDVSVDYAEGYLFNYPKDGKAGRSNQSGRNLFMVENFGYRIRYHKLTKPEAAVDRGVFERMFHMKLRREGVLSGRALDVEPDYDRKFVQIESAIGAKIDEVMSYISEQGSHPDKDIAGGFRDLQKAIQKSFTYLKRMQLLEAIKADAAIADIKKHIAMGRKVVVFHDFNVGGGSSPFKDLDLATSEKGLKALDMLNAKFPDLAKMDFAALPPPNAAMQKAFPDAMIYSGLATKRERQAVKKRFNTDKNGSDVIVVQSAAGEAGIDLHDTTGAHQRVLINLGMPVRPTTALQEEGRIRRVGVVSNAAYRYYTTGTTWERQAFAAKIAENSGTVENLALGDEARSIREAFVQAYIDADLNPPSADDGIGGKAADRGAALTSPFDQAKAHYFGRTKTTSKRSERDGIDFYPTPEPLAFKMVEWAGIRPYEKVLEPSAGDGAIARYFPQESDRTIVEPSAELNSRAQLRAPGSRAEVETFEDHHIVNKYNAIVMNPPFGMGGKTAMEHLAKAMRHLKAGGRIVALVPSGPSANKRLEALDMAGFAIVNDIALPDVTFEKAGTSVQARVLIIDKMDTAVEPGTRYVNMTGSDTIAHFFDRLEGIGVPARPEQTVDPLDEAIAAAMPVAQPGPALTSSDSVFDQFEFKHSMTGQDQFGVQITERLGDRYAAVAQVAKGHGGSYSKYVNKDTGAKRGFLFKAEQARADFIEDMGKPVHGGMREDSVEFENAAAYEAVASEEVARLMPQLRAELDRMGLTRVVLSRDETATWQGRFQVSADGLLEIMIGASLDPTATIHHEAIHALREMNLFTKAEWDALAKAATRWLEKHDIAARYPDLTYDQQIEEAIAEEFAAAMASKKAPIGGLIVQALNKLVRLLKAIKAVMVKAGHNTPEAIFGRVFSGQIGSRVNPANPAPGPGNSFAYQANPVPVESLSGDELGDATDIRDLGRKAEAWYRKNMLGSTVINEKSGMVIEFNNTGAKKIGGRKGDILLRIVPALESILQKGDLTQSEPDSKGNTDIAAWHTITATVSLAGKPHYVVAKIKETRDGKFHYDLSKDMSDGANLLRDSGRTISDAIGLDDNPVEVNIDETAPRFNEKATKYQAARLPSRQARAHMATQMGGQHLYIPDRGIWEELTRTGAPIWSRISEGKGAAWDAVDRARIKVQDRFLPMLRAQQAVEAATGRPVNPDQNAYRAEELFSSKVGHHLRKIEQDYLEPIIDLIVASKGTLTADSVGEWLYARHAIERNARMAQINPRFPDGGSGMMTADAQAILAQAAASPNAAALDQIGILIHQLRERNLTLGETSGLLTNAQANAWRMFKHYVPLKGFADTDNSEAMLDITGVGRKYNVKGAESRRALGRGSLAFNPLQAAITQAQEVAIRAEKNVVGAAVYELVQANPSPALWEIKTVKMKQVFNRSTGLVESRPEDPITMLMDPNEMAVKIAGKEHRIIFHDPRLAEALGSVGADRLGIIWQILSTAAQVFRATRTTLAPPFVMKNAVKDMITAQINNQAFGKGDRNAIAAAMATHWPQAFAGAYRGQKNKSDTKWTKYYEEFEKAGAKVSFWKIENPEVGKAELDRRVHLATGNRAQRIGKVLVSPKAFFNVRDNKVLGWVERVNLAVDNATRLAAYVAARESGWTESDAASMAKNLTVNFNRRGQWGPIMNIIYPFSNSAIQGGQILFAAMSSRRVQAITGALVLAGFMLGMANAYLSDEDDDGVLAYDKIPNWHSEMNMDFMLGKDSTSSAIIPLPYGYNVFPYMGQQMDKVRRGVKSPTDAMADVAFAAFKAFSPIGGGDALSFITPTLLDPMVEVARNQDWTGKPIMPDNPFDDRPQSQKFYKGATEASKAIAASLNSWTGGTTGWSGTIDVSPEHLDHFFGFAVGSAGTFWGRSVDAAVKLINGEDVEVSKLPIIKDYYRTADPYTDSTRYFNFRTTIEKAAYAVKQSKTTGETLSPEVLKWASLAGPLKVTEKARKDGRDVYLGFNKQVTKAMGVIGE